MKTKFSLYEKEIFLETFVCHFIQKHRRERTLIELTDCKKRHLFTNRLNHRWEDVLIVKQLQRLSTETERKEYIARHLNTDTNQLCYVLSCYADCDNQWLPIQKALDSILYRGLASLLITEDATRIYLETEVVAGGKQNRFIGIYA